MREPWDLGLRVLLSKVKDYLANAEDVCDKLYELYDIVHCDMTPIVSKVANIVTY